MSSPSLNSLAARWYMIAALLVAMTRCVARLQERGDRRAWEATRQLEVIARVHFTSLAKELSEQSDAARIAPKGDYDPHDHLRRIAAAFLILAIFAQQLRNGLAGRGAPAPHLARFNLPADHLISGAFSGEAFRHLDPG